jgi:hypothetical protein
MAAVFERQPGHYNQSTSISPMLADRLTPLVVKDGGPFGSWATPMMSLTSDWMYDALDQIVLDTPPPDWSKDGWVFAPIDVNLLPAVMKAQNKTSRGDQQRDVSLLSSASNVTIDTTAMRARLQCEKVSIQGDEWFTDELAAFIEDQSHNTDNLTASNLNITGKLLPQRLFENSSFDTTVLARSYRVLCCSNKTEDANSAVAYWSFANTSAWWSEETYGWTGYVPTGDNWPSHFVIKNIVGSAFTKEMTMYTNNIPEVYKPLQFKEVPSIQALDCKPIIEQAQAKVTVARSSGHVLDFKLLEEPHPRSDVWKLDFDIEPDKKSERDVLSRQATAPPTTSNLIDAGTEYTVKMG